MDVMMLSVTGAALLLAIVMAIVAVRLLRAERARSTARVDTLQRAALGEDARDVEPVEPDEPVEAAEAAEAAAPIDDLDVAAFTDRLGDHRGLGYLRDPIDDAVLGAPASTAALFAAPPPAGSSRRLVALAAVALVMAAGIGGAYVFLKAAPLDAAAAPTASASTTESSAVPARGAAATAPIELLSLKHTADGATFSVTGLVQNPLASSAIPHVVAVVYVFDKDGTFITSGKADVEFTGLRPGEESPFVVRIPNAGVVAKYRVGFRRDDGSVIAHVDKRNQAAASLMTESK